MLTLIIKMQILFTRTIIASTARASSVFLSSFSINLLTFYHECHSLIAYATVYPVIDIEEHSSMR